MINAGNTSLVDFVVKKSGSAFALLDYAINNKLSLNDILTPGQFLEQTTLSEIEPDNFNEIIEGYLKKVKSTNVISGQSLYDLAIQEIGTAFGAIQIAIDNKISLNEILLPGEKIIIPTSDSNDEDVVNYFKGLGIKISTYKIGITAINPSYELPGEFPYSF